MAPGNKQTQNKLFLSNTYIKQHSGKSQKSRLTETDHGGLCREGLRTFRALRAHGNLRRGQQRDTARPAGTRPGRQGHRASPPHRPQPRCEPRQGRRKSLQPIGEQLACNVTGCRPIKSPQSDKCGQLRQDSQSRGAAQAAGGTRVAPVMIFSARAGGSASGSVGPSGRALPQQPWSFPGAAHGRGQLSPPR